MLVSIIIPAYNAGVALSQCLSAAKAGALADTEIIVVDDGSTDATVRIAESEGVRVVRLDKNSGPAAARNCGARCAHGDILFFVDSDVVLAQGAVDRVKRFFRERPEIAAMFGSYDAKPTASGVVSQYRNLLHHFVHQNGNSEASTFWAGCGAIRRSVFEQVGGFDEKRFRRPSIEDIELGYRLRSAGYRILLDKALQATHLKQWTLVSFIKTDIACRAIPWSRLILETKVLPNDLNLKWDQRASFLLLVFAWVFLAGSILETRLMSISVAAFLVVLMLNRRVYLFFLRQRGLAFGLACIPLHMTYYLYSGFSYLYVRVMFLLRNLVAF